MECYHQCTCIPRITLAMTKIFLSLSGTANVPGGGDIHSLSQNSGDTENNVARTLVVMNCFFKTHIKLCNI